MTLNERLETGLVVAMLPGRRHMSFPATFALDGQPFLVPESCADRTIEIHACVEFPGRWRLACYALQDIDAADTVIFQHNGRWWLITSIRIERESSQRFLSIFHTDNVLDGNWQAHPINARRLYQDKQCGFGRNAGPPIAWNGKLLRPMQSSSRYYGQSMTMMEIETLTPEEFRECPLRAAHLASALARRFSPHHFSQIEDIIAVDIRDRHRPLQLLNPRMTEVLP